MAVQLVWQVEKRVVSIVVSGVLDLDAIHAQAEAVVRVMNDVPDALHVILDLKDLEQFPPLIECIRFPYFSHPRRGTIMIIGLTQKPQFRILVNSLITGLRLSAQAVETVDEAMAALRLIDPTL